MCISINRKNLSVIGARTYMRDKLFAFNVDVTSYLSLMLATEFVRFVRIEGYEWLST